jgi:hypothetical protein
MDQEKPNLGASSREQESGRLSKASRTPLTRRSVLRVGAAATPVVLTFASGPVAATGTTCVVASSFISRQTFQSRNPSQAYVNCATKGINEWFTECGAAYANSPYKRFLDQTVATAMGAVTGTTWDTMTCKDLVLNGGIGVASVGQVAVLQHLVGLALALDAALIPSPGALNKPYLQSIWTSYKNTGGYRATGVTWDEATLLQFLLALQSPKSVATLP